MKQRKISEKNEKPSRPEKEIKIHARDKSQRRKVEEKEIKEQKNQATGAVQAAKEKATSAAREKLATKSKLTDTNRSVKSKADSVDRVSKRSTASTTSTVRSAASTAPSASKIKKEATNKTKKEEVTNRTKLREADTKPLRPKVKSAGARPAVKAAAKTAAVAAVAAVVADNMTGQDEEVESIVEKHQIEAMETSPIDDLQPADIQHQYTKEVEDDIEPELERIKDEEEDAQDIRIPDIPSDTNQNIQEVEVSAPVVAKVAVPKDLDLAEVAHTKPHVHHVKTPDEVDDLPEHEAVEPDDNLIENDGDVEPEDEPEQEQEIEEEKIALDLQEKEQTEKKEDDESKKEIESDGAQEQKEVVEVMVAAAEKIPLRTPIEETPQSPKNEDEDKDVAAVENG